MDKKTNKVNNFFSKNSKNKKEKISNKESLINVGKNVGKGILTGAELILMNKLLLK